MKPILEAEVISPDKLDVGSIDNYNLIGFASGVYMAKHDKELLKLVEKIPFKRGRKAFTVTTSGVGRNYNTGLNHRLIQKGFEIVGEFTTKGWDTFFILALFGGINKGKPNEEDLERARQFAQDLKNG